MQSHKVRAKTLGAEVVKAERAVEALFRSADVDSARLRAAVQYAARAEANYGVSHLETHVRMRALLSDDQVAPM